jgi:DNA-binding NarL/FixJ family response regulator
MVKIKVLIIDDHSIVRAGVKSALQKNKRITVCAEAANASDGIEKIKKNKPDVVVLDLSMPGVNGMEILKIINTSFPQLKILIFTMHDESEYVLSAIEQGVNGYLLKDSDLDEIEKAILSIHAGNKFYSDHLSNIMANAIQTRKHIIPFATNQLTIREKQVLGSIVKGLSNKMTAETLNISIKTVSVHRTNIMKKLNAANTADLVRMAIENKIT